MAKGVPSLPALGGAMALPMAGLPAMPTLGAMGGVKFVPNLRFPALALQSTAMLAMLGKAANDAAEAAKQAWDSAGPHPYETGEFRDSIKGGISKGGPTGAGQGIVTSDDWTAGFLEFGTVKMQAFAPLRRGAEMAGYKVTGSSRE